MKNQMGWPMIRNHPPFPGIMLLFVFSLLIPAVSSSARTSGIELILERIAEQAMEGSEAARDQVAGLLADQNPNGQFEDIDYHASGNDAARSLLTHGRRLHILGQAYFDRSRGNPYTGDAELMERIAQGWVYLAEEAPENTAPNWWWNKIGLPVNLGPMLVLVRHELQPQTVERILEKYYEATRSWFPGEERDNNAGGNLTDRAQAGLIEGLLLKDSARIREIVAMIEKELLDHDGFHGAGLQPDYSMHQHPIVAGRGNSLHRSQLYSGNYGIVYAEGLAILLDWLRETTYEFAEDAVDEVVHFVLDGQQWFMRGKLFEPSATGRAISRRGAVTADGGERMKVVAEDLLVHGKRTEELLDYMARIEQDGPDEENFLSGNRAFWLSDAMTHHRKNYMAAVRMISERTIRPETQAQNKEGYYMGDGFMTVTTHGGELGPRGGEIFPVWDWERLPGITAAHTGNVPFENLSVPFPTSNDNMAHHVGARAFTGSVSDGNYGMAAMDYAREPVPVRAKKSWFFFDDEIVALGSGITSSSRHPVRTSLNQVLLNGEVVVKDRFGATQRLSLGFHLETDNPQWVFHDGIGYVFLDRRVDVTVKAVTQTGRWEDIGTATGAVEHEVFSLSIDHGVAVENGKYSYVILPGVTEEEVRDFYPPAHIGIVANDESVQAIHHRELNIYQAAFFEAGSLAVGDRQIRVNMPALVMLREKNGQLDISVSDPRQSCPEENDSPRQLFVDFSDEFVGDSITPLTEDTFRSRVVFNLPRGKEKGRTITKRTE